MDHKFKVISFYTENTPYEKEIQNLIESLNSLGIPYDIQGVPNLGSWHLNIQHKTVFIHKKLIEHKCPLVWLDADAVVKIYPHIFNEIDTDTAFYFRVKGRNSQGHEPDRRELISAAMYFKPTINVYCLLEKWEDENNKNPELMDQQNLHKALKYLRNDHRFQITVSHLPQTYSRIFDAEPEDPVIIQNQASRRFRGGIDHGF